MESRDTDVYVLPETGESWLLPRRSKQPATFVAAAAAILLPAMLASPASAGTVSVARPAQPAAAAATAAAPSHNWNGTPSDVPHALPVQLPATRFVI